MCLFGIIYAVLQWSGYLHYGFLMGTEFPLDNEEPMIYQCAIYIISIAAISALLAHLLGYAHILFRFHDYIQVLTEGMIIEIEVGEIEDLDMVMVEEIIEGMMVTEDIEIEDFKDGI